MNKRQVLNSTIMMILLPCAVLLCLPFVCASLPSLNDTSTHALDASNCQSCNTRTLWDILLNCGLTVFACTWTAIHPNIPGMHEGKFGITSRRLCIMVMALIAPELMITWAARQFFSARRAAKNFYEGSFDIGRAPIRPCPSTTTVYSGNDLGYDLGHISETTMTSASLSNIPDASGSPSAFRFTPPGFNFESPCTPKTAEFRRWTVTHGFFAWMGGFMLYVNGEPRGTLTPDELLQFVRQGSVEMPIISKAEIEGRSKGDPLTKGIAILQLAWFVSQLIARYVQNLPITLLEIDTLAIAVLACIPYGLWWKKPKDVGRPYAVHWKARALPSDLTYTDTTLYPFNSSHLSYVRLIQTRLTYPFASLMGLGAAISPRAARSRRIPSLGGYGSYRAKSVLLIGCISGMMFGGIHCLGWNYFFHRNAEHILWRATSLGIACAPVFVFLDAMSYMQSLPTFRIFGFALGIFVSYIYIAARVTLIVLMMLSLRSPPPGVYDTVAWTTFIPHFNM